MNSEKISQSISHLVSAYAKRLDAMSETVFKQTPLTGGWGFSEVYSHIFDSSLLSLTAIQNCQKGKGEIAVTSFGTRMVLFFGTLPPGRKYKAPKRLAARVKKIEQEEARQFISDFELQLAAILPIIKDADVRIKVSHPRLGPLNALQWLRFIEIHFKHHLKQLSRIEKNRQE